jgi:hypothetical protein
MDNRGDVRTAYEFKDIFDDTGASYRPYRCPFCEVPYEDRCIVTQCVKAPHFKLPNGTFHLAECDGEPNSVPPPEEVSRPSRRVVGDVDIPEALVARRPPRRVRPAGAEETKAVPGSDEIRRRRRLLGAEREMSSKFTSSLLRNIVVAHRQLMQAAHKEVAAHGHARGTPEYSGTFVRLLEAHPLELFEQRLTYRSAFFTSRLSPANTPRIYMGTGVLEAGDSSVLTVTDKDGWPRVLKGADLVPFVVKLKCALPVDAPASHIKTRDQLLELAESPRRMKWAAYGLPQLDDSGQFELVVESPDHLFWEEVR